MPSVSWCYHEEVEQYLVQKATFCCILGGPELSNSSHPIRAITGHGCRCVKGEVNVNKQLNKFLKVRVVKLESIVKTFTTKLNNLKSKKSIYLTEKN